MQRPSDHYPDANRILIPGRTVCDWCVANPAVDKNKMPDYQCLHLVMVSFNWSTIYQWAKTTWFVAFVSGFVSCWSHQTPNTQNYLLCLWSGGGGALSFDALLDLSIAAVRRICLLHPCCLLISTSSCRDHSNLLNERGVPSMVICPYWSLWLELLPNITKLHLTLFNKHTEPKFQKIKFKTRTLAESALSPRVWHLLTPSHLSARL